MKNKKKIFSCIAGIIILFFACFWGNYEPEETEKESAFKGIISLYDTATPTVLGNDFSVISTICEEFSSRLEGSFVRLSRISHVTEEESYLYASENADIIRYDESLAKEKIITDKEFTAGLKRDHYDIPAPYDNGKVIVPLW
ncbi:MAG: hypothetical protein E7218_04635, partial [Anaerofustis stercorihominis]|nr:hypothetical protein [Anaerofustis stercorihominis]